MSVYVMHLTDEELEQIVIALKDRAICLKNSMATGQYRRVNDSKSPIDDLKTVQSALAILSDEDEESCWECTCEHSGGCKV